MAYEFPNGVKFATVNLERCRSIDDFGDPLVLGHDISVHKESVYDLDASYRERVGRDLADGFARTNIVIMASRRSLLPTVRDEEWQDLDRRVFMMFYAVMMQGTPRFSSGTTGAGGVNEGGRMHLLQFGPLPPFYFATVNAPIQVSAALFRAAEAVVAGMIPVYAPLQTGRREDFRVVRRGLSALIEGWKANGVMDRLHAFVRALDGLMRLPVGAGRIEFGRRVAMIATGATVAATADAIYRLRSFDEHLSDWPITLSRITEPERPEFIARHSHLTEALANHAYRTVLASPGLRAEFQGEASAAAFWNAVAAGWPASLDLDAEASRYLNVT